MLYILPREPSSPVRSLKVLREQARRAGYRISADRNTGTFTLIDATLRVPLAGLHDVGLAEIANAIEIVRTRS
jgi:hypothetical protein